MSKSGSRGFNGGGGKASHGINEFGSSRVGGRVGSRGNAFTGRGNGGNVGSNFGYPNSSSEIQFQDDNNNDGDNQDDGNNDDDIDIYDKGGRQNSSSSTSRSNISRGANSTTVSLSRGGGGRISASSSRPGLVQTIEEENAGHVISKVFFENEQLLIENMKEKEDFFETAGLLVINEDEKDLKGMYIIHLIIYQNIYISFTNFIR